MITQDNLIENLKQGRNEAYEYLYANCYISLKSFCNSYIHDPIASEDIIHDLFISLINIKLDNINNFYELKLYLFKSVKNRAISYIRHLKVSNNYSEKIINENNSENDFYYAMLKQDVYDSLVNAIEMLPNRCAEVMKLSVDGYTMSEIAKKLNISIDTVKEHKMNGKSKLRRILCDSKIFISYIIHLFSI